MPTHRENKDVDLSMQDMDNDVSVEKQRFIRALEEARVRNKYSQRQLCDAIGITIGTLTKYNRGSVDPMRVGVAIMRRLAGEIGVTTNTLMEFIETGEFRSSLSIDDVASWIRSESGQADLPELLAAMSQSTAQLKVVGASASSASSGVKIPESITFSDADARIFQDAIASAFEYYVSTTGTTSSRAWGQVQENLVSLGISENNISIASGIIFDQVQISGELMTAKRKEFGSEFEYDPLCKALKMLDGLEDYEPLDRANTLAVQGVGSSWLGYSDDEARAWGEAFRSAMDSLAEKLKKNKVDTWFEIEEHMIRLGVSGSECSMIREYAMGTSPLTGRALTACRDTFKGRFEEPCPVIIAMQQFKEVKTHKGVLYCSRICREAERNVPELIAA